MSYQALYRTWRPQTFASLIGQPHVRQTLMNALSSGQIAHAYLFCGPRGTGKTSTAKLFAKAVNCLHPIGAEPCNECDACISITRGNNVDVEEIDAASNRGVDEIRELREKVHYAPTTVKKKVYIVDEVHMLTTEAFNALLKTLEEPPDHVIFMLATTEVHKIPNTIISRCQRFDLHRISVETIVERLREVVSTQTWTVEDAALWKLAEAADGGLRDALGLLEQAAAFGRGQLDEAVVANVIGGVDTHALLQLVKELAGQAYLQAIERLASWYANGKDANRIAFDLLQVLRDLFIVMLSQADGALGGKPVGPYRDVIQESNCSSEWLIGAISKLGELYTQLRYVEQPRLALESSLLAISAQAGLASRSPVGGAQPVTHAPDTQPQPQRESHPEASPDPRVEELSATASAPASRRNLASGRNAGGQRKREVLERLYADRNEAMESVVMERWGDILHKVKQDRIQTHAWLMNGEVVMATDSAIVLSFASRIHREAVMKVADRKVIEASIALMMERDMQIFALLKADWDEFINSLKPVEPEAEVVQETEIVERAKVLFGEEKVMVEHEE